MEVWACWHAGCAGLGLLPGFADLAGFSALVVSIQVGLAGWLCCWHAGFFGFAGYLAGWLAVLYDCLASRLPSWLASWDLWLDGLAGYTGGMQAGFLCTWAS
jgi:ABC-type branched-subunit amino acid transport system permease subunit